MKPLRMWLRFQPTHLLILKLLERCDLGFPKRGQTDPCAGAGLDDPFGVFQPGYL